MKFVLFLILTMTVSCHPKMFFKKTGMQTVRSTPKPPPPAKKTEVAAAPQSAEERATEANADTNMVSEEDLPVTSEVLIAEAKPAEVIPEEIVPQKAVIASVKPTPVPAPVKMPIEAPQFAKPKAEDVHFDTEYFEQKETKVDILFIVDNSPSMRKEQLRMAERLQFFMKDIQYTDWQIAFTTSDVSSRKYSMKGSLLDLVGYPNQKVLTKDFADSDEVFLNTVYRPEGKICLFRCPSSKEQPLKASILAMEKHDTENSEFFREDADLSIVILTDEDEMSHGGIRATKPYQVIDAFHSIFGPDKKLSVYGIIVQPNDVACIENQTRNSVASPGTHVSDLSQMTGGYTGSICDTDYTASLEKIGESTRLASDFYQLKRAPLANTVKVKLLPEQNIQWNLKNDQLTFTRPPKTGTQVQISYKY